MSRNDFGISHRRDGSHIWRFQSLFSWFFLCLLLSAEFLGGWTPIFSALAASPQNPNPPLSAPDWLQAPQQVKPKDLGIYTAGKPDPKVIPIIHPSSASQAPVTLTLTPKTQHFLSSDGQLELEIPANTVSSAQVQSAGGTIHLQIVQIDAGSGGSRSGHIVLGIYKFLLQNAAGKSLTNLVLSHALTIRYHLPSEQATMLSKDQVVNALWNDATTASSAATGSAANAAGIASPITSQTPTLLPTKTEASGLAWSIDSTLNHNVTAQSGTAPSAQLTTLAPAVAASTITFSTQAPQASWGTPTDFQVGLNSGGLNYSYPLSIPPGPGGFTPPVSLAYSSGAVNESHNVQATAPWVGEGWNLSLGSISWSQLNVTPGAGNRLENVWNINDPSGISGQLIPPDLNATTSAPASPAMSSLPAQYIWHTAPESHAKVQEVNFNGSPCWHVWLPSGVMEEFGCIDGARQAALDANSNMNPYRWDLDLMVDRYGNQVRINYQRIWPSNGIRDAVISSIEYDDPSCHNTAFNGVTAACSTWNPQVRIIFDASTKVASLANTTGSGNCSGWTDSTANRCDDPSDLSGSGGLAAPKVVNTYVLNDVQVQVQGNLLHKYVFSYEQTHPFTITDPLSGQQESVIGYLDLTQIQEQGTNGTSLNAPVVNVSYQEVKQYYEDQYKHATPSSNCATSWTPRDGSGCFLWAQSYNARYIQTLDNGRGWHETMTWNNARANVHGVDSGAVNDVFTCNGHEAATNLCSQADDGSWSRVVVAQRQSVTNGITSTWAYKYYLRTGWPAYPCSNCNQGDTWGNINDNDYADYYNTIFTSFDSAQVTNPDNSYQISYYASSDGIGLASSSITCYSSAGCRVAPYSNPNPGIAGREKQAQSYGADGKLLSVQTSTYAMNCPPAGVPHSNNANGPPKDIGNTQLSSELDQNNPVVVCDPRVTQQDSYKVDGVTDINGYQSDPRVLHQTTTYTYDGWNCGSNYISGYDYGNVSKQDVTANDVWGQHFISDTMTCPNDNVSGQVYLTNLPAQTQMQDASGTVYGCHVNFYGGNTSYTVAPSQPDVTRSEDHTSYSDPSNDCAGSTLATLHGYDASGNAITGTDADNHLGCSNGTATYSACATYDTSGTHLISALNAKEQTTSYQFDSSATGGFGQWVMSTTDPNDQTTSYQYDVLGRLTALIRPGDSTISPTTSYSYINTCTNGSTNPCLELDTTTRVNVGGTTSTTKQWYDGAGHLVETIKPGPTLFSKVPAIPAVIVTYTLYDNMGRATTTSMPYAIANNSGKPGTSGSTYVTPDPNKPRTVTSYDGAGRSLGTVTYSNATTIVLSASNTYTVVQGIPSFNNDTSTAFERVTTLDAYNHQQVIFNDAMGQDRYEQAYSGTGTSLNSYTVIRTVQHNYDTVGNVTSVLTYDAQSNQRASYSATYDGTKRLTGWNDTDSGSCSNIPLPAGCSSSSDTAWKVTYDADGNQLSQIDPRGQALYTSYDVIDRPLCRGTSAAFVNPCQNSAYATFFYDSYDNSSNPTVAFPVGCVAPSGSYASDPVGMQTSETFSGLAGRGWRCTGFDQRGQQDMAGLSITADSQTTTQTVSMAYNDAGQVTSLVYPDGETLTSQYDTNGSFRSAYFGTPTSTDPVNFLVGQTTYTTSGLISQISMGGSAAKTSVPTAIFSTSVGYDGIQRPLSSSVTRSGTTLWNQTRTYDNTGNVLGLNTTLPTTSGGTKTDVQSFCYDELNRLVWAGNTGTPTGGDHCGSAPTGTSIATYQQPFSYDALDRFSTGPSGTTTYSPTHIHAATSLGTVPSPYASYDDMGNMICRNVDPTTAHSCGSSQTGATMTYDNEGRLETWTAPSGTSASDKFLYDNAGNRVLQRTTNATTISDTITFDSYTEITITGGTTSTTKHYSANGLHVAMRKDGILSYPVADTLGSSSLVLKSDGTPQAVQLFAPFGKQRYADGSMPTTYNFTGQRLDSQTGLLYYGFRYYDPVSGQFARTDTTTTNAQGADTYAYVGSNPEGRTDANGHCWPLCTAIAGAIIGGIIGGVASAVVQSQHGGKINWAVVGGAAAGGAAIGALVGAVGPAALTGIVAVGGPALAGTASTALVSATVAVTAGEATTAIAVGLSVGGTVSTIAAGSGVLAQVTLDAIGDCSFTPDTHVATNHGEQAIGTLKVGDQVEAYNPKTHKMEQQPIVHVWIHPDDDLVDLTITSTTPTQKGKPEQKSSEVVHTNQEHPFLTAEKGFLPVGQIKVGMHVVKADGSVGVITSWTVVPGAKIMYNLEVANDHTFTVGDGQWVVHNHCDTLNGGDGFGFKNQFLLNRHFVKHNNEFSPPFATAVEYEQTALNFMTQPQTPTLHQGQALANDNTIDTIRVDDTTGWYGIQAEDGSIRSLYIPDPTVNGGSSPVEWFLNRIDDLNY